MRFSKLVRNKNAYKIQ